MVGNVGYRTLELIGRHMLTIKRYPLMINAYSFGKTFYEVLGEEVPFQNEWRKTKVQPNKGMFTIHMSTFLSISYSKLGW
jgi:hypothetical protein